MAKIKTISYVVGVLVALIIVFGFISNASTSMRQAADSIPDANNCTSMNDGDGNPLYFNASDNYCWSINGTPQIIDGRYNLPISSLFASGGVAMLILMGAVLIAVITIAMKRKK